MWGVSADDGLHLFWQVGERLVPSVESAVDKDYFVIVAWSRMTEVHEPKTVHVDGGLLGHAVQQFLMFGPKLCRAPDREWVFGQADVDAAGHLEQLTVGVPAQQHGSVSEIEEPIEDLSR